MSARRKKESKKNLKVTFTQAYPTRRFYLCFPSNKKFNESGIILDFLPVEHPCRWHIWWYKSTLCRCLGRGQGPAERKVPWLNGSVVCGAFLPLLLGGLRHPIQLHSMATPNGVKALRGLLCDRCGC